MELYLPIIVEKIMVYNREKSLELQADWLAENLPDLEVNELKNDAVPELLLGQFQQILLSCILDRMINIMARAWENNEIKSDFAPDLNNDKKRNAMAERVLPKLRLNGRI